MTTSRFSARVTRNVATMKGASFRRGLLVLIPVFYAITVAARVIEGVGFPRALWDLGSSGLTLLNMSGFLVITAAVHWFWFGRRNRQ